MGRRISKEFLHPSILEGVNNKIGNLDSLETDAKGNMVQAINELVEKLDNSAEITEGKKLIADAIGEPVSADDTFSVMSEAIIEIRDKNENTRTTLANLMVEGGYRITGDEDINVLLELLTLSGISISDIKNIVSGYNHMFVLKNDGIAMVYGLNDKGQLGLGDTTNRTSFLKSIDNVKSVHCGYKSTFVIKNDGSLWATGYNNKGNLGLGNTTNQLTFIEVDLTNIIGDAKIVDVCSGGTEVTIHTYKNSYGVQENYSYQGSGGSSYAVVTNHTVMLLDNGTIYVTGDNSYGQLGLGNTTQQTSFVQVPDMMDVKQISCSEKTAFIIKNDGTLYATGHNADGKLGLGDTSNRNVFTIVPNIDNVSKVVAFSERTSTSSRDSNSGYITIKSYYYGFTSLLKEDGTVWTTGYNGYGQLGLGNTTQQTSFVQVPDVINVKDIVCGRHHVFLTTYDGVLLSCGLNDINQLGLGDMVNKNTFNEIPKGL